MTSATTSSTFALTVPGSDERLVAVGNELVGGQHRFGQLDHGIWDLVPSERRTQLDRFAADYVEVRQLEGRDLTAQQVRRLPHAEPEHPLADMWTQRRQSFERMQALLADRPNTSVAADRGRMIDIGAGCGWLAAHLARDGWTAAALDVTVGGPDGLGAARHHDEDLLLLRGDMSALPMASGSVELAVFNASLHYAHSISDVVSEARRAVSPGGRVVVLDSPVFQDADAGRQMVTEFERHTQTRLGVKAAQHQGPGFLTWDEVHTLGLEPIGLDRSISAKLHAWRGSRRAGREVAARPLLVASGQGRGGFPS